MIDMLTLGEVLLGRLLMEFFANIKGQSVSVNQISDLITIDRLPELCASIDSVVSVQSHHRGEIYCVWGQFQVSLENIRNGVRLALLSCPHALAWTVAVKNDGEFVVVHCTIDDEQADAEFVETIEQFVEDWTHGLKVALSTYA